MVRRRVCVLCAVRDDVFELDTIFVRNKTNFPMFGKKSPVSYYINGDEDKFTADALCECRRMRKTRC